MKDGFRGETTRSLRWYGLESAGARRLAVAASLHDMGKLGTPPRILEKSGPLNDDEFAVMRRQGTET